MMIVHAQKKAIFVIVCLTALLAFGLQGTGHAASALDILPAGDGVFIIQGTGIESAGAMDFSVLYDVSTLANPRVVQGGLISGAMMVVNDKALGSVRFGIIRTTPIQGSGVIATITFDRKGSSAGKIISVKVNKFTNVSGQSLPVTARISNPADSPSDKSGPSQAEDAGGTVAGAAPSAPVLPGVIVVPGAGPSTEEKKDQAAATPQPETQPAGNTVGEPGPSSAEHKGITASLEPQDKQVHQFESVLERFRNYRKERTAKAFLSLFDDVEVNGFRQDPPVALSDGKTVVKIFFIAPASSAAPDYVLRGASLVSIKKDAERSNAWMIEAQPEKGEYEASLTVSQGDVMLEYPLVVAPEIKLKDGSKPVTDEDFSRYLSGEKKDLNGDGRQDYLDDYIFTANFIAAKRKK